MTNSNFNKNLSLPQPPAEEQLEAPEPVLALEKGEEEASSCLLEEKILLEWESPNRPFKKQDRRFFMTILGLIVLVSVFLIYLQEFLLIAVLLAALFVSYALSTNEPELTKHVVSTRGIESAGHLYTWDQLKLFWFGRKLDQDVLNLDTKLRFPGRLVAVLSAAVDKEDLKNALLNYIPYLDQPQTSWMDTLFEKAAKLLKIS